MPIMVKVGYNDPITIEEYRAYLDREDKKKFFKYSDTKDATLQRQRKWSIQKTNPQAHAKQKEDHLRRNKERYQRLKSMYSSCLKEVTCPRCKSKILTRAWNCTACKVCKGRFHIKASERVLLTEVNTSKNKEYKHD